MRKQNRKGHGKRRSANLTSSLGHTISSAGRAGHKALTRIERSGKVEAKLLIKPTKKTYIEMGIGGGDAKRGSGRSKKKKRAI